jgi:hypothetical protein
MKLVGVIPEEIARGVTKKKLWDGPARHPSPDTGYNLSFKYFVSI